MKLDFTNIDFNDLLIFGGGLLVMGSTWWLFGLAGLLLLVGLGAVVVGLVRELSKSS